MSWSLRVVTALLCSASFIPFADAAPGHFANSLTLTDWHVAPVLSSGRDKSPYCALATSYPTAGAVITYARNKHGSGTIAFDFQQAEFEPHQHYGLDIAFDGTTQQFAAEARNTHMLVVDLRNDHPLYSALDAGHDFQVSVQQGGPQLAIAGNSRAFFQLNYCVQALNGEPAGTPVTNASNVPDPSFGLQQPVIATAPQQTTRYSKTTRYSNLLWDKPLAPIARTGRPVLATPANLNAIVSKAGSTTASTEFTVSQNTVGQDGDESRADLGKMLDQARGPAQTTQRQKLNGMSSNDIVPSAANDLAQRATTNRDSLLYDDGAPAESFTAPRLSDQDSTIEKNAVRPSSQTVSKMVATAPVKTAPSPIAKTPMTPAMPAKPLPTVTADKPSATKTPAALPPALALASDNNDMAIADSLSGVNLPKPVTPVTPPPAKTNYIHDETRIVNAKDYANGTVPATNTPEAKSATPPVETKASALAAPVVPQEAIMWDAPATESPVAAASPVVTPMPVVVPPAPKPNPLAAATSSAPVINTPVTTTKTLPGLLDANRRAALLSDAPAMATAKTTSARSATAPVLAATAMPSPKSPTPVATAHNNPMLMGAGSKLPTPPVMPSTPLQTDSVLTKAVTPAVSKTATLTAKASVKPAPVMPAASVPPAFVEETVLDSKVRGPMRPANEAIQTSFADDSSMDAPTGTVTKTASAQFAATDDMLTAPDGLVPTNAARRVPLTFTPPAASTTSPWQTKNIAAKPNVPAYCILQNHFINQQNVFLSRGADGSASLGLDYNMELLQADHDYKTTIQVDNAFNEDFIGHANQPNLLIVTLGRKDSLFQALASGKAMHIEIEGGASTFDISGIKTGLPDFNNCLTTQGGASVGLLSVAALNNPVALTPTSVTAPATVPMVPAKTDILPLSMNAATANKILQQANIQGNVRQTATGYQWGSRLDTVQGEVKEQRFLADKADLLEAAMRDIDGREQSCHNPSFTSEIGAPDQHGSNETVKAETSCTQDKQVTIAALLYQRAGQIFRVWSQTGPQSARDQLIRQRDRLAKSVSDK